MISRGNRPRYRQRPAPVYPTQTKAGWLMTNTGWPAFGKILMRLPIILLPDNPQAARGLVQRIFRHAEQLVLHPGSGSVPRELRGTGYRQIVEPPCRVFYRFHADQVIVLHVLRGEMKLRRTKLVKRDREAKSSGGYSGALCKPDVVPGKPTKKPHHPTWGKAFRWLTALPSSPNFNSRNIIADSIVNPPSARNALCIPWIICGELV